MKTLKCLSQNKKFRLDEQFAFSYYDQGQIFYGTKSLWLTQPTLSRVGWKYIRRSR